MGPSCTHLALHVRDLDACVEFYRTYCSLSVIHARDDGRGGRVVWLAEAGRETEFAFVLLSGGAGRTRAEKDYGHIGFACAERAHVDTLADRARTDGRLLWAPRQEPYPVGYYCGVIDPDGTVVEFSYGQPLGPGSAAETSADASDQSRIDRGTIE